MAKEKLMVSSAAILKRTCFASVQDDFVDEAADCDDDCDICAACKEEGVLAVGSGVGGSLSSACP